MALTMSSGSMPAAVSVDSDMMSMALAGASLVSMTLPESATTGRAIALEAPGLPVRNLTVTTPQEAVKAPMGPVKRDLSP